MKLKYAIGICLSVFLLCLGLVASVVAHPHIWIMAKSFVIFNDEGQVATLRHQFTFDEAFSAWAVQGLDTDGDGEVSSVELSELTEGYLDGLSQYGFYTFAGAGDQDAPVVLGDNGFIFDGPDGLTLDFELDLQTPVDAANGFDIAVLDQEYYVAIEFVEENPIELVNPPASCRSSLKPPTELDPEIQEKLFAIGPDVLQLPADLKVAVRDASTKIHVVCGDAAVFPALTAVEAVTDMANSQPARPFGGPAVERGLPVPRDGVLGWIYQQQQDFYRALTAALSALQTENQAIWVLGTLSFLYGVFHAAGPGHGKLVISSYVIATERQLSRGIAMSFASAFVQALVAIGFVLVAAVALRMTSVAMSGASQWLIVGSYAMVAVLGAWLMLRHIMGWGHSHNHDHSHDHHDHEHHAEHDGGHDHVHNVTPEQTSGNFWEMVGVVVSVGMRPCSGALVVLVFSLSQGLLIAGIISTLLMALGTGITVAVLASFAVFFKGLLAKNTSGAAWVGHMLWWLELLGAALVLAFGVVFLLANI